MGGILRHECKNVKRKKNEKEVNEKG